MRSLILWADNHSANLGVRVLAEGTKALILKSAPAMESIEFQDFEAGDSSVAFNAGSFKQDIGRRQGPIKTRLHEFDLVVDTGAGDSFTDGYGWKRLLLMQHVARQVQRQRIPMIMSPQTIGPFDTARGKAAARRTMDYATAVIARDSVSANAAFELTGHEVPLATDVVFALDQSTPTQGRDVIFNASGLLWENDRFGARDQYRALLVSLIDRLLDAKVSISVMAHVLDNPTIDNDCRAIEGLREIYGTRLEYLVPDSLTDAREMLAGSKLLIGSRMHACLNAISQGVPALPLAYSRKFGPLFADLGWRYNFPIADAASDVETIVTTALELRRDGHRDAQLAAQRGRARLRVAETAVAEALTRL